MNAKITDFETFVAGRPAPQGSKKVMRGRVFESSPHHRAWRARVHEHAQATYQGEPMTGPLAMSLTFWMERPKSQPKLRRTVPYRRPDADKLARSVNDSLVTAGVIHDDSQVVDLHVYKRYVHPENLRRTMEPDTPGVSIAVNSVADSW